MRLMLLVRLLMLPVRLLLRGLGNPSSRHRSHGSVSPPLVSRHHRRRPRPALRVHLRRGRVERPLRRRRRRRGRSGRVDGTLGAWSVRRRRGRARARRGLARVRPGVLRRGLIGAMTSRGGRRRGGRGRGGARERTRRRERVATLLLPPELGAAPRGGERLLIPHRRSPAPPSAATDPPPCSCPRREPAAVGPHRRSNDRGRRLHTRGRRPHAG